MSDGEDVVIVIDDDQGLRDALESLLCSVGLTVRLFESVAEFRRADPPAGPCCLVLDVRLPGKSGLDLQTEMIAEDAALPIIFITGHADIPMTVKAMKSGAVEFLSKPFRDQELLDAIHSGLERDRARRAVEAALGNLRQRLGSLTQREREVMSLVVTGRLNKQIAGELHLSEITVKVHRGQVMRKMEARSVADLVRMADRLGLAAAVN